jgi:hypothetical protein
MTAGVYTTTVDILGDADPEGPPPTNEWGDELEEDDTLGAGVPARIVERPARVVTEGSREPVTVHYYVARLPHGTVVTSADRIRDRADGLIYQVDYVARPANPALPQDVRLDLKRVT